MTDRLSLIDVTNEFRFASDKRSGLSGRFFENNLRFKVYTY